MASRGSPLQLLAAQSQACNGVAIIITNDYNYPDSLMKPLTETHKDGLKMARVLGELNYGVYHRQNLPYFEMQALLHEATLVQFPRSFCSIVIVFSGHGTCTADEDKNLFSYIITQDCRRFSIGDFVDYFNPKTSKQIAVIPKVFLIDACLGNKNTCDYAVTVPKGVGSGPTHIPEMGSKGGRPVQTIDLPPEGNYILAHSTSIGYQSYEITGKHGGVWLNALSEKIRDKGRVESVPNILSEVSDDLMNKYQDPFYKNAMTQPHYVSKCGIVHFVPKPASRIVQDYAMPLAIAEPQLAQAVHKHELPCQSPVLVNKGHYMIQLNNMEQAKRISRLKYRDLPKSKHGLFLAEVTFVLTATGEPLFFKSSTEMTTAKEAYKEAARIACRYLDAQAKQMTVPKSAIKKQVSCPSPVKRQVSCDQNPLQRLKEGCEGQKRNYTFEVIELSTGLFQRFQFRVIVRDAAGRLLCKVDGSKEGSKQAAKYDAASKVNAKLDF